MTVEVVQDAPEAVPPPGAAVDEPAPGGAPPPSGRRIRWGRWALAAVLGLLLLVAVLAGTVRLGARTDPGRAMILRMLDGLPLGPVGRLQVQGLQGDPFGAFRLSRLAIVDAQGPWLEASDIAMRWTPSELLGRRVHAEDVAIADLRVLRQPVMARQAPQKPGKLPVSIAIDALRLRLQTLPAFSGRPGLWDVAGGFRVARSGAADGRLDAQSRLHAGDGLSAQFQLGETHRVVLRADAVEASGGALAGALGLPTDQRLLLHARADGTDAAGALSLVALSGARTPLNVQAGWSKAGTTINAEISFAASRLTGFLADRAGPDGRLALTATHAGGDLYDLRGTLSARDASLAIAGPVDWRLRRTPGLSLRAQVADLSRWVPFPKIGATTTSGMVTGDLQRFQYRAAVDARALVQNGYSLGQARGSTTLTRTPGEWRVQANLAGAGGSGQGLLPALLGPAPRVQFDLSQLGAGQLLFRQLDVQGAGLKLDATGDVGLFGGLAFKGNATVSNLAAAHPGARGVVTAAWTAEQPKGSPAWTFGFDAKASNFASGLPQADHFLGSAPALTAKAAYGPQGLSIAQADLSGGALQATVKGLVDPKGAMNLDVGWSAKGPFDAGPVEIAGQAKGTGKLTGTPAAPSAQLAADLVSVGFGNLVVTPAHLTLDLAKDPAGVGGQVALNGSSRYGPAVGKAAFRLDGSNLDLSNIAADAGGVRLAGALSLRDGAPSTADLALDARAGAFLSAGHLGGKVQLSQRPGGLAANVALDGQDVSVPGAPVALHTVHLAAAGPWARLPFTLAADSTAPTAWKFAGQGVLDQAGTAREVDLSGQGRVRDIELKTVRPAVLRLNGAERDLNLQVSVGGGQADVDARQVGDAVDVKATLAKVALAAFSKDYVGAVNGNVTLTGRGAALGGSLDAVLSGARTRDAPANLALDGKLRADLAGPRLHLVASATNAQGLQSALDVVLPAAAAAQPFHLAIDRTKPMQGSFSADGELRPLWDLLIGGEQSLSGHVVAKGTLGGDLADPSATGSAALAGGRFADAGTGLVLQNLALSATFDRSSVQVSKAQGSDGHSGTMSGEGTVSLARGGGSTFALKLSKFRLFDNDLGRANVSGDLTVNRNAQGHAKLSGALKVDRADIVATPPTPSGVVALDVVEINRPNRPGEDNAPPPQAAGPPVALDVAIKAQRGVFVRGRGLDVELSLDAHVSGTAARPDLSGTANVVLGSYDFAGKRFDFDQRGVIRLATDPAEIRLDLSATLEQPTLTAVVKVTGTALRPEITLSSTPVLPQDEVLSEVLFGASASQLSPAQAAELASALASLSRGGGFDLLGRLRQFAGLDRLALGAGTSGTGVAGGKYINDNVYVELIGGGREGPSAAVEWRVRKNFSIVSQVGTQGDAQLSIQFRKNY